MPYSTNQISEFSTRLIKAIRNPNEPLLLIESAAVLLPFQAALCVVNRKHRNPYYLCDTYTDKEAKQAVQHYIKSTYLINPVYNSFLTGIETGLHRMRDLAPDNWEKNGQKNIANASLDSAEEIGFLTHGWPARLEELVLVNSMSEEVMVEISFAQPSSIGGFSGEVIEDFRAFLPMFLYALDAIQEAIKIKSLNSGRLAAQLQEFGDPHLTQRENEVIQLILQGHSGKSICSKLSISMPTLKSHRKNAYAKLNVENQKGLFNRFILWKHQSDNP